jgi:hypothetical protein
MGFEDYHRGLGKKKLMVFVPEFSHHIWGHVFVCVYKLLALFAAGILHQVFFGELLHLLYHYEACGKH